MPSVSIYRPPAARKLEQNSNLANIQSREMVRGSSPDKGPKELGSGSAKKAESNGVSVFRNAITSIRTQNKSPKCKSNESTNKKSENLLSVSKSEEGVKSGRERRPDIQVYVPKGRRSTPLTDNNIIETSNNNSSSNNNNINNNNNSNGSSPRDVTANNVTNCAQNEIEKEAKVLVRDEDNKSEIISEKIDVEKDKTEESSPTEDEKIIKPDVLQVTPVTTQNEYTLELGSSQSCDPPLATKTPPLSGAGDTRTSSTEVKISEKDKKNKDVHLNPDEDDWESMFDDSGECLDPSLLEQLTSAVGEVTIEKPKESYEDYKTKSLDVVGDEFPHVIEIYNFPPEFQLHDLMTVFSQFKNSGFEIKWVDDTHALGIFSSSAIVSEVLSFYHPFVKTRSLKEGTTLSKMKARRSAEFLQPYKPRPDTCPALARRLVTGALGVKLPTSREEREAEKKILTKAREKKRLEAKQKEDAWEGTFS